MISGLSTARPFEKRYMTVGVKNFSKLGSQEVLETYPFVWNCNGKAIDVQVEYKLSGSGDDSLLDDPKIYSCGLDIHTIIT